MVWQECRDLQDTQILEELARRLHMKDVQAVFADGRIKARLRADTEAAIAQGVFGVPTFQMGEVLFWGLDSLDMMLAYLNDPKLFATDEMRKISMLPEGTVRKELAKL